MIVLGVDPGYQNLGIALVDTSKRSVLASTTVACGGNPWTQHKILSRELPLFLEDYPKPDLIATETPPFGFSGRGSGGKTACLMWHVIGGLSMWAAQQGIQVKDITPTGLKAYAGEVIGMGYNAWPQRGKTKTRSEIKWGISEAVKKLLDGRRKSSAANSDHEADAVLIAFALGV